MFTGIVEEVGKLLYISSSPQGGQLTVEASLVLDDLKIGDSVAINGVCLTVVKINHRTVVFDTSAETLERTTLGKLRTGSSVNLERAMKAGGRFGGHIVQGHVDGVGLFLGKKQIGESFQVKFSFPVELGKYICLKGSITVEGTSLTVSNLGSSWFEVAVIPHTWRATSLALLTPGMGVNLEVDVLAKYLERLLESRSSPTTSSTLTLDKLRNLGY